MSFVCFVLPLLNSCWFIAGFSSSVTGACNWHASSRQQQKQYFIQALVDNFG